MRQLLISTAQGASSSTSSASSSARATSLCFHSSSRRARSRIRFWISLTNFIYLISRCCSLYARRPVLKSLIWSFFYYRSSSMRFLYSSFAALRLGMSAVAASAACFLSAADSSNSFRWLSKPSSIAYISPWRFLFWSISVARSWCCKVNGRELSRSLSSCTIDFSSCRLSDSVSIRRRSWPIVYSSLE